MDKYKSFAVPKPVRSKSKRPTVEMPSTSKKVAPKDLVSRKSVAPGNFTMNSTLMCAQSILESDSSDIDYAETQYENFCREMLAECLVEDKIKREETQVDIQMAQLAARFQETMDQLDKTSRRLKDISFVVEQKRLLELKSQDCSKFYDITDNSGVEEKIDNLILAEEARLDTLQTHNVDFGYNNETGHKKLLDTVNDAIKGLEDIKKNYSFDADVFQEFKDLHSNLDGIEKDKSSSESLKNEIDLKFPKYHEELLKDVSDKIALFIDNDD